MKIILSELLPVTSIKIQPNLNEYINPEYDLLKIDGTKVDGKLYWNEEKQELLADVNIKTNLTQACSITLLPVEYFLEFSLSLIFSNSEDDEDSDYYLENEINLDEIIFAEIFANKKYQVFHESADRSQFVEEEEKFMPFANLLEDIENK